MKYSMIETLVLTKGGKMKCKYIAVIIIILFVCVVISFVAFMVMKNISEKNDICEIQSIMKNSKSEYKSDRGFGNDRFDIYSFTLKKTDKARGFRVRDIFFDEKYNHGFASFVNGKDLKDEELKKLKSGIEEILKDKELQYMYVDLGGTSKIYLYSKKLNKGYCLIVTI